jgi:hypothetical protein
MLVLLSPPPPPAAYYSPVPGGVAGLRGLGAATGPVPSDVVDTIAATIQNIEGYYPGSLAYQNNNPGNLIYVGQSGAVQGAGGYAYFPTYNDGLTALKSQIQNYGSRGLTIQQTMDIYAPAGHGNNNPTAYAQRISDAVGAPSPDTLLTDLSGAPLTGGVDLWNGNVDPGLEAGFGGVDSTTLMVIGGLVLAFLVLKD